MQKPLRPLARGATPRPAADGHQTSILLGFFRRRRAGPRAFRADDL